MVEVVGVCDHGIRKIAVELWRQAPRHGRGQPRPIPRHLPALLRLCLAPLFKRPAQFMVVPNGDPRVVETGEKGLVEPDERFVFPKRSCARGVDVACLRPPLECIVAVWVGEVPRCDFRAQIMPVERGEWIDNPSNFQGHVGQDRDGIPSQVQGDGVGKVRVNDGDFMW